jgi:hypothetical protein
VLSALQRERCDARQRMTRCAARGSLCRSAACAARCVFRFFVRARSKVQPLGKLAVRAPACQRAPPDGMWLPRRYLRPPQGDSRRAIDGDGHHARQDHALLAGQHLVFAGTSRVHFRCAAQRRAILLALRRTCAAFCVRSVGRDRRSAGASHPKSPCRNFRLVTSGVGSSGRACGSERARTRAPPSAPTRTQHAARQALTGAFAASFLSHQGWCSKPSFLSFSSARAGASRLRHARTQSACALCGTHLQARLPTRA